MSELSRYDVLFKPIRIGPKTAPNRFYGLPYATGPALELNPPAAAAHYGTRAEGGWGVITCGECTFTAESRWFGISIATDEEARGLAVLPEAIHEHGALASLELSHPGAISSPLELRVPALAPSQFQFDAAFFGRTIPKALEKHEIRRIQDQYVEAAIRARDIGFDLVNVYGGHSNLFMQFLSPFYNQRTDEYGGSFENRARVWRETIERVREAIGDDCGVVARIAVDSLGPAGIELDESLAFIRDNDHLVDLWDCVIGSLENSRLDLTPSRVYPEGYALEWSMRAREATTKLLAANGRLTSADLMATLVSDGTLDLVAAARPGIADPFLPAKIREGRFADIAECIGCNQCAQRQYAGSLGCTQNPTAGEEFRRGWHPERFDAPADTSLPVLIVGAGPAGMEAAVVLGRRGFEVVHLVDERTEMGGHLRWFSELPGFRPWARAIELREQRIERLPNISIELGKRLDAATILEYQAAIVVIATGAAWSPDGITFATHAPIPGADSTQPHVITPEQLLLEGKAPLGTRVVVVDGEGELVGCALAQHLQTLGCTVDVVSPWPVIAMHAEHSGEAPILRREIVAAGGTLHPASLVTGIGADAVAIVDEFDRETVIACDSVVLATQRCSREDLYRQLVDDPAALAEAGIVAVHRIGDCIAPRLLAEATFDGHRLGRLLQADGSLAPDPAIA